MQSYDSTASQKVTSFKRKGESQKKRFTEKGLVAKVSFPDIIGSSPAMVSTKNKAKRFSGTNFNILLVGESGTGKEMFAQAIHLNSERSNGPFVAVNCASIPETLLESELFGYVEGAFSGAKKGGKIGLFELAHEGTIFLDEIGAVGPSVQARLLRVIQEKEIICLGDNKITPVNVRIITATNEPLLSDNRNIRDDFFFRINELSLLIPPLRERGNDIYDLADYFLVQYVQAVGPIDLKKMKKRLKELLGKHLYHYDWPGNVRELENIIKRFVVLYDENCQDSAPPRELVQGALPRHLFARERQSGENLIQVSLGSLKDMETEVIRQVALQFDGGREELAKTLGISRSTLWRKIKG